MSAFIISGDGTTYRNTNTEARHMAPLVPELYMATDPATTLVRKQRLLGVESSPNHTSEVQVHGWKETFSQVTKAYNHSPLAQRLESTVTVEDCAVKLTGMGGDHAADQFKTTGLINAWKKDMTYLILARNHRGTPGNVRGQYKPFRCTSRARQQGNRHRYPDSWRSGGLVRALGGGAYGYDY